MTKLYKHFKGKELLDKNIYEIISYKNKGKELDQEITYTGEKEKDTANNLIIYQNIFNQKLFAREEDDFFIELPKDKQRKYKQIHRVEELTKEEMDMIKKVSLEKDLLLKNINKIHTTKLGLKRISKNISIEKDKIIDYCKEIIANQDSIIYQYGKNYYCINKNIKITINKNSYTIITGHIIK